MGVLDSAIDELGLSVRARNSLNSAGIHYVRDLVSKPQSYISSIRNLGLTTIREINDKLAKHGLSLGMRPQDVKPKRKIIQLVHSGCLVALCDDGSAWQMLSGKWYQIRPIEGD